MLSVQGKGLGVAALLSAAFLTAGGWNFIGGETVVDDCFDNLAGVRSDCEKKTMIMQFAPRQMVLGGPGENGDEAAFYVDFAPVNSFVTVVDELSWGSPEGIGGSPTTIAMTDADGNGYAVHLESGAMQLQRLNRREATPLGDPVKITGWPEGGKAKNRLIFARNADGAMLARLEGAIQSELEVRDDAWKSFGRFRMGYGVFVWGYGCQTNRLFIKTFDGAEAEPAGADPAHWSGRHLAVFDADSAYDPVFRSGKAAMMAEQLRRAGATVELIAPEKLESIASRSDLTALIIPDSALGVSDLKGIEAWIRSGRPIVFLTPVDWTESLQKKGIPIEGELRDRLRRMNERIFGYSMRMPIHSNLLDGGKVEVLPAGKTHLGELAGAAVPRAQVVPLYNSCLKQALGPEVAVENWLAVRTRERNWIQQEDIFVGIVAQLQRHTGGEYAGARVFFSGLPLDGSSPWNPARAAFVGHLNAVLSALECTFEVRERQAVALPELPKLTRENFFNYPGAIMGALCFGNYDYLDDNRIFAEDMAAGGFEMACYCVPWLLTADENGEVVDWKRLDWIVEQCGRLGRKLMLDPYPVLFDWGHYQWRKGKAGFNPAFRPIYLDALKRIVERYKDNDTLVAMWATSYTGDMDFASTVNDKTPELLAMWQQWLQKRYGEIGKLNARYQSGYAGFDQIPFPEVKGEGPFNIGPEWYDFSEFHIESYQEFLRDSIRTIRSVAPTMPLTTRGGFMDVAVTMEVAAEFPGVAAHSECVETTYDTEGFFRSLGRSFEIPITAENGWPKASAPAMRMALSDYLMGDYSAYTYSFDGPRWARDVYDDFRRAASARAVMKNAHYPAEAEVGLLVCDTTLLASRPPSFMSVEKLPHLQSALESCGFPFIGVSAQHPRFKTLKVIIDDGVNQVFTPEFRDQLLDWIEAGGIFVAFPSTGSFTFDGSESFRRKAELPAEAGTFRRGRGRIIQLEKVPARDPETIVKLLTELGMKPDVTLDPMVPNAMLKSADGSEQFLILFDKSPELVGSFFTESTHAAALARLPERNYTIRPARAARSAVELFTGETLTPDETGAFHLTVPPAELRVIQFHH